MSRGSYAVQEPATDVLNNGVGDVGTAKRQQRDNSFRSCIHAMVIFLVLCLILMLAAFPWGRGSESKPSYNSSNPTSDGQKGGKLSTTLLPVTTKTTTTRRTTKTSTTTERPTTDNIQRNPLGRPDVDPAFTLDETTVTPVYTTPVSLPTFIPTTIEVVENIPITQITTTADATFTLTATTQVVDVSDSTTETPDVTTQVNEAVTETRAQSFDQQNNDEHSSDSTIVGTTETSFTDSEVEVFTVTNGNTDSNSSQIKNDVSTTIITDETSLTTGSSDVSSINNVHTDTPEYIIADTTIDDISGTTTDMSVTASDILATTIDTSDTTTEESVTIPDTTTSIEDIMTTKSDDKVTTTEAQNIESTTAPPDVTCSTGQCKVLASRMLSLMNHTVDACEDFYEYSCGGLRSNKALKEDSPQEDVNSRINVEMQRVSSNSNIPYQKFKHFYEKCLDYDHLVEPKARKISARNDFDSVGTMHTDTRTWESKATSFTELISRLMVKHSTPIMDVTLDVDGRSTTSFVFRLTPPIFTSPFHSENTQREMCKAQTEIVQDFNVYYESFVKCELDYGQYIRDVELAIKSLGLLKHLPMENMTQIIQEIRTSIEWNILVNDAWDETDLPRIGGRKYELLSKKYEEMTIGQLQNQFSLMDWKLLFQNLLGSSTALLSDNTVVQVYFKSYFEKLFKYLQETDQRVLHNSLLAMYAHDLYVDLIQTHEECGRESYCLRVASALMEDVASSLYLSSFDNVTLQTMRTDAEELFEQLRTTMDKQLSTAQWLDETSKSNARSKLSSMKMAVDGGISVFLNDAFLEEEIDEVETDENNYLNLAVKLVARNRRRMYGMYKVDPSSSEAIWSQFLTPYKSHPVSIYGLNTIVIPYGMMNWPLYEPNLPRYLKMARLGFVIAHEMTHHFDTVGVMYRAGKKEPILTSDDQLSYNESIHCSTMFFQKSYKTNDGKLFDYKLNPLLTLNERLSDNMGAMLAYDAYKQWVSTPEPTLPWIGMDDEKLFYIALSQTFCSKSSILDYAVTMFEDEHLPPFLRVESILQNSDTFSDTFKCSLGGKMNIVDKCNAFPKLTKYTLQDDQNEDNMGEERIPQPS